MKADSRRPVCSLNRSMRDGSSSERAVPFSRISSAMSLPTAGECIKPCPLKPQARYSPRTVGALPDGPGYDSALTAKGKKATTNGAWLCQRWAKPIDSDPSRYTVERLVQWKRAADKTAIRELESGTEERVALPSDSRGAALAKVQELTPGLIAKMGDDLRALRWATPGS